MAFTIAVIRERRAGETRVAATPDTVKKFKDMGAEVLVETGAGLTASYTDDAYKEAGAKVVGEVLDKADLVLSVRGPEQGQASALKKGAVVVALLDLARRERTRGPKWVWVLVIVFINIIGPILYLVLGRDE